MKLAMHKSAPQSHPDSRRFVYQKTNNKTVTVAWHFMLVNSRDVGFKSFSSLMLRTTIKNGLCFCFVFFL